MWTHIAPIRQHVIPVRRSLSGYDTACARPREEDWRLKVRGCPVGGAFKRPRDRGAERNQAHSQDWEFQGVDKDEWLVWGMYCIWKEALGDREKMFWQLSPIILKNNNGGGGVMIIWSCGHGWTNILPETANLYLCLDSPHTDREGTSDSYSSCLNTRRNSTGPPNIKACRAVQGDGVIKWISPARRGCVLLWCGSRRNKLRAMFDFCCYDIIKVTQRLHVE